MVNAINLPVSRKRMEKYQNMHTRQIEHAAKQWEARQSKVQNNLLRKEWMEHQTGHNYTNEYDRLRGYMSQYRPAYLAPAQLRNREMYLRGLVQPHLPH